MPADSLVTRLTDGAFRLCRAGYYRFVYDRRVPGAEALARRMQAWERRHRPGDIPIPGDVLDAHYAHGRWRPLHGLDELARYSVLVGYLHALTPGGAVLDVGCGDGLLFRRYRPYGYARYVGVDVVHAAIAGLASEQDDRTRFIRADAESYTPDDVFDAIVFNESLYYFRDPLGALERYIGALREGGVVITSMYTPSPRAGGILRRLKATYALRDEVTLRHGAKAWTCSVFAPGFRGAARVGR